MTAIEPTMTREEARERTTTIRGKLSDALEELVSAYFDGVHTALGYDDWDTYVHEEFGEVRFKLAAADRGERVRELRGKGMPVKVTADLFGVTERTVKRDTTGGQMSPERVDAQTATESIRSAVDHLKGHRENLTSAIRQHPDLMLPVSIEPPMQNDVAAELLLSAITHQATLLAMLERSRALKTAEGEHRDRITQAFKADAETAGRLSARKTAAHHAAKFLGRSDEIESMAAALGLRWSDDEGHYIIVGMEDLD